jgi:hypothetical protein
VADPSMVRSKMIIFYGIESRFSILGDKRQCHGEIDLTIPTFLYLWNAYYDEEKTADPCMIYFKSSGSSPR